MKKSLSIIVIFTACAHCASAQSIRFVPLQDSVLCNPLSKPFVYHNKLYFASSPAVDSSFLKKYYSGLVPAVCFGLAECDNEIRSVPMPDEYTYVAVGHGFSPVYNGKIYLTLESIKSGSTVDMMYEYNGSTLSPLSTRSFDPDGNTFTVYNQKLYSTYSGGRLLLLGADGFQPVNDVSSVNPGLMVYKNKLVYGSAGSLTTYDGVKTEDFDCDLPTPYPDMFVTNGIVYKNDLYTSYIGSRNLLPVMGMVKFNGSSLQFIDNPAANMINDCDFSVSGDYLYYSLRSLVDGNYCQLVRYNGSSTELIPMPPNTKYAFTTSRVTLNQKLYMLVQNYSNPSFPLTQLAMVDSNEARIINSPEMQNIESDIFLCNNKIYGLCTGTDLQRKLFAFDGISFQYFSFPTLNGTFLNPVTFKNTLYFVCGNRLAFLE